MPGAAERGCLVLADISGYSGYVVGSPLESAEDVVADVTETVVGRLEPVVRVNKLEGDAVFGYALDGEYDATMLLDTIEECYFAFRGRLRGIEHAVSCTCPACAKVADLDLKFVVHHGEFVRRGAGRREELTGHDVIVVHRLLKNSVAEAHGLHAYVLFTDACLGALDLEPVSLGLRPHAERYPDVGEVRAHVSDLEARWREEQSRRRIRVGEGEADLLVEALVPLPPEAAWELLTSPQKRLLWQVDTIEQADTGGRRHTGTSSVCVDGRTKIYEEILDWRPFEYVTERLSLPRNVRVVLTTAVEPRPDGTRVVALARRERAGRLAWAAESRRLRGRLEERYARLASLARADIPAERRLPLAAV
ncbi:MAG TPA: DUF2652 domain-containing protein [Gaiellaceae bacterium]|nr:DUF2652 domain-containing protein [Gaiellaceae bacterium]